ncbi:MAG TPA: DNA polymerase III subunit delta [Gammaproteobacteria bacterium]|nr:DNA polymerase III subunit delta [Gammaproteobacteria bacterium]
MKIKPEQLAAHLKRGLAPVYLVYGDEPLQLEEACDAIRAAARAQQHERDILHAGTGFDWGVLAQAAQTLSLFSQRRLLELRIATGKPGDTGSAALVGYATRPPADTILLVICPKLDSATQKTKWFTALEQAGVVIQVWPVPSAQLPAWIIQRMRAKGMQVSNEAAAALAERVEGNLLAAAQDIEKLYLLYGPSRIEADTVTQAVADSARFDIYGLADTALAGDAARTARMLSGLRAEGVEPTLLLWALVREVRSLANLAHHCQGGLNVDQALAKQGVWEKRKPLIKQALQRHKPAYWQHLLRRAAHIDLMIKGMAAGNVWDELLQLSLAMAGIRLLNERAGVSA